MNSIISNFFGKNLDRDNLEKINNTVYIFNVFLFNGTSKVGIKFSGIDDLTIIDDLRYFYSYGHLTFSYNNDPLEAFESLGDTEPGSSSKVFEPYVFRGDGRDLLLVEIMPQLRDNECLEISATEGERERFCIKHTFSVYKYDDKTDGSKYKRRTLYFWDKDYQLLNDIEPGFSTHDLVKRTQTPTINVNSAEIDVSNSSTNQSVPTGEAIKGLLTKSLSEGFKVDVKFGEWDEGGSTISYSAPASHKAIDDLEVLLSFHVSTDANDNLPCILKKQRYTEKYELIPISAYYQNGIFRNQGILGSLFGGSKFVEDFYIGKVDTGSTDIFASMFKSPLAGASKMGITDYNTIDNYKFTKISATDLQKYFTSYAVHTTDPRGFFITDLKTNNYQSVKKMYSKVFLENSPGSSKGGRGKSNIPDTIIRETHQNPEHVFFPDLTNKNERKSFGINKSMINLFFKNTSITFRALGNTIRKSGQFFSINRRDSAVQKTFDNSVLGQYLAIYVRHEFRNGAYNTVQVGTKPYVDEDPQFVKAL